MDYSQFNIKFPLHENEEECKSEDKKDDKKSPKKTDIILNPTIEQERA